MIKTKWNRHAVRGKMIEVLERIGEGDENIVPIYLLMRNGCDTGEIGWMLFGEENIPGLMRKKREFIRQWKEEGLAELFMEVLETEYYELIRSGLMAVRQAMAL